MIALLQLGDVGRIVAVAGQLGGQADFQAAQACISNGAGKGFYVLVAIPVDAFALPARLPQVDRLTGEKARQSQADGPEEILVADDANAFAGRATGKLLQAGVRREVVAAAAQAVDLPQVEDLKRRMLLLHQTGQHRMRLRLVFLDWAG